MSGIYLTFDIPENYLLQTGITILKEFRNELRKLLITSFLKIYKPKIIYVENTFFFQKKQIKKKKTVIPPSFSPNKWDLSVSRPTSPKQGVGVNESALNEPTQKIQLFEGGFLVHIAQFYRKTYFA